MSIKRRVETLEQHVVGDGQYYIFQVGGRFKEIQSHEEFLENWCSENSIRSNPKDLTVMVVLDFESDMPPQLMYSSPKRG